MNVRGDVQVGGRTAAARDTASGFGDIQFFPLMLLWKKGDLSYGANFGIYAPTGEFTHGAGQPRQELLDL
jgi:hypothetical protein